MAKQPITAAMVELRAAITEAETISAKAEMTKRDEARVNVLLAKIAALRKDAVAPDDSTFRWFRTFLSGSDPTPELRGMQEGTQTISWTDGSQGGYFVPQEFYNTMVYGMAQYDPLLDENVCTVIRSDSLKLRPYRLPGWDLSTFAATKVAESAQQLAGTPPTSAGQQLNGFMYRLTLDATLELEQDDFQPIMDQMQAAYTIGFARGIGEDLALGNGSTAPQGVLSGASNSGVTLSTGFHTVLGPNASNTDNIDFQPAYFSVNRYHRASPRCAWVMSDATYQWVRKLTDGVGRPLVSIKKDVEVLMGKPVLVSPSIPSVNASLGTPGYIVFGDLAHYFVRVSRMTLTRNTQAANAIEYGKALYTGRMRADAQVFDPSGGNTPPLTYITLTA